jgi:hypothetical protein
LALKLLVPDDVSFAVVEGELHPRDAGVLFDFSGEGGGMGRHFSPTLNDSLPLNAEC